MRALEDLKISVADESRAVEERPKGQRSGYKRIQHSASSLGIEGMWDELSPAINFCAPPSAAI